MKLVQIPGKRGRTVPVLLQGEMVVAMNIPISTRLSVGDNAHNPYIFARPNKDSMNNIRGPVALTSVVENEGLISPEAVTSTKLRKYTATVCQVFNLQEREIDWLTRHMGHDVRVHSDFHRQHESAVESTKIRRILMTVDSGDVSKSKGRFLDEINLQDFPDVELSERKSDDEHCDSESYELPTKTPSYKNGNGDLILISIS
ncbi:hypothetical protein JTB14_012395 [Gonioctena quinquepunctata]|nr:hypothetical protein JTB14_012395 [Gonioctena quinquepunctata]